MKLKLDPKSLKPLHLQAEELLRGMILLPEYMNGKLLPNEVELSHEMNISRNTLRQAINKLVFEGLLTRKKGYGTTVVSKNVLSNARNWMSFSQEMASIGLTVKNFELHISHRVPDKGITSFFETAADRRLLCIERLRGTPDMPFVYFISWFNPGIGMTGEENLSQPLYDILEKEYGVVVKTSREKISAMGAPDHVAEKLCIEQGDPILVRKRQVYDMDGLPVEYNIGYYRADSFTYAIECSRE